MKQDVSRTCGGACCAVFPLSITHPIFRKGPFAGETAFIADMVIPLTRRQALRRSRRLGYPDPLKYGRDYALFTCRHWDEQTRLCTVYDKRPSMCRDYPYEGRTCERGCGYKLTKVDLEEVRKRKDSPWLWDARRRLMVNRAKA